MFLNKSRKNPNFNSTTRAICIIIIYFHIEIFKNTKVIFAISQQIKIEKEKKFLLLHSFQGRLFAYYF
jgi:hypothetical protein